MLLSRADIINFKNIEEASIEFSPQVNCVLGSNAMGKSNLLEAIHFLSFVRGFRSMPDSGYMRHGADTMLLKGEYLADDGSSHKVSCGLSAGKRKSLKADGKEYQRISQHIGRYPVVVVTPQDSTLVTGSGEERRRFMDMVISQADGAYLSHLMQYSRALESRNRMLRSGIRDDLLYESVEAPMCAAATALHAIRSRWTETLNPLFGKYHRALSAGGENVDLSYSSALNSQTMKELLDANRRKDTILGFTSGGPHRDDLTASLEGYSMRRLGSQGQIKTFTTALKLAVFDYLKQERAITPMLLLDDIFDKLDASRVEHIMQVVGPGSDFGQIFITDTNREHLDRILSGIRGHLLLEADHGRFTPVSHL